MTTQGIIRILQLPIAINWQQDKADFNEVFRWINAHIIRKNYLRIKEYDVVKASLSHSWVRGEQTRASDIDMLVEFKEGKIVRSGQPGA